jgi:hypothetical protein
VKTLRTYVFQPPEGKGSPFPGITCINENGDIDSAVVNTLLSVVAELSPREYDLFESLMSRASKGNYDPAEFSRPRWSGNECAAWFGEPRAGKGHVLIANQYVPEYSEEDGEPQRFTFEQLRVAMQVWRDFKSQVGRKGILTMLGETMEVPFPGSNENG